MRSIVCIFYDPKKVLADVLEALGNKMQKIVADSLNKAGGDANEWREGFISVKFIVENSEYGTTEDLTFFVYCNECSAPKAATVEIAAKIKDIINGNFLVGEVHFSSQPFCSSIM